MAGPFLLQTRVRPRAIAVALVIGAFLVACTWPAPVIGFDGDDVTNLIHSRDPPASQLAAANLVPFTTVYRPMGSLYYRVAFALFGWRPHAFRLITFALILANVFLVYAVARRLSRSAEIGAFAALLFCFHAGLRNIYMSNGAVYDVLCATFSLLTLWSYMAVRESFGGRGAWRYAVPALLFIAALNAKEMAAILPALFLLYEWIYYRRKRLDWAALGFSAFTLLLSGLAFWGKRRPGSLMYHHELYTPAFTVRQFFINERLFLAELFYLKPGAFNTTGVVLFYLALFAVAWLTRKKHLWLLAWSALLSPLPVIFIVWRGMFVMYLPYAAFAMYAAALIVFLLDSLRARAAVRVAAFALLACLIPLGRRDMRVTDPAPAYISALHDGILRLNEPLPDKARILFRDCGGPDDDYRPVMMFRLLYRDREIWADCPGLLNGPADPARYDRVMNFSGRRLTVLQRNPANRNAVRRPSD